MIEFEYEVTDNSKLVKETLRENALKALEAVGTQAASFVSLALKGISPSAKGSTSGLLQSIDHEVDPEELAVYIGSREQYAVYVHEGTGKYAAEGGGTIKERWVYKDNLTGEFRTAYPQKPRRFLKKAIEENLNTLKEIFLEYLKGEE